LNTDLATFERFIGLPAKQACLVLGVAYVTYAHYRSGHRELPGYHAQHIKNLQKMNPRQLQEIIKEVCNVSR
jgi:hypothetical protein